MKTVNELLSVHRKTLALTGHFAEAFGYPERSGVWFVWGNSGNGKSSFVMQLCKELTKFGTVVYDSLEEGESLTMVNMIVRYNMQECGRRFYLLNGEDMKDLSLRMSHNKSINFYVIDSLQYTGLRYRDYIELKEMHKDKLIIFISHADGRQPRGSAAKSIMYDAALKIYIEGFRAFSNGRFYGSRGQMDIWADGAEKYWGENKDNMIKK